MRNSIFLIALVLAISSALATNTATFSRLDRIAGSVFGKTILETVQVEMETSADPRPRIIQLLEELKQETIDAQTVADNDHNYQQGLYASTLSQLQTSIDNLNEAIRVDSEERTQKQDEKTTAEDTLRTHQTAHDAYVQELTQAKEAREANQRLFEEKDAKFGKILDVLAQVRTWIQNRRDTRYEFLQKKENIFPSLAQIKSEEFMKVSPGYGKLIGFLATKVEKVLQPTYEDTVAEGGLDSILRVIDNLIAHFQSEKVINYNWNQADLEAFEATRERLETNIATEAGHISTLNIQIANLEQRIGELTTAITTNQGLLDSKLNEKTVTENSRDEEQRAYEKARENRNHELGIIDEVLDIVRNELTGLREYTENRIINSDIKVDF